MTRNEDGFLGKAVGVHVVVESAMEMRLSYHALISVLDSFRACVFSFREIVYIF